MIKFNNVRKTYKNSGANAKEALRGVSFLIDDGEFVFIIGKSGSGKSTLLKCMNCEERPSGGTITIDGFPISDMSRALVPVLRRQVGMIFQDFRLIETKTVAENISFAGEMMGLSRKSLHQKVQLVLNIVGLKDKSDAYPQQLSGGEQQRIAIARAMLNNPKLIIADEPTGNLDPETSENIMGLLLDINRSGTTVIVCTHDANLVDRMKKRVIEIEDGIVVRDREDSAYADEEEEKAPEMSLNVDFGEDADYHAGYDEDTYNVERPPVGDFYFGDTPAGVAPAAVTTPVPVPVPTRPGTASPLPIPESSFGAKKEEPAQQIPFGGMTDITELPVENEIEEDPYLPEPVEIIDDLPEEESVSLPPVPAAPVLPEPVEINEASLSQDDLVEEVPVSEFYFGKAPEEHEFEASPVDEEPVPAEEEPAPAPVPVPEEPEVPVEDDSWLKEVRMDDIDLDIQEDDDE